MDSSLPPQDWIFDSLQFRDHYPVIALFLFICVLLLATLHGSIFRAAFGLILRDSSLLGIGLADFFWC
jgi:hypothetical protein